jgi:hypothetical protein
MKNTSKKNSKSPTSPAKKTAKTAAKKTVKPTKKTAVKAHAKSAAQKAIGLRAEVIDQVILSLAARPYSKIMKQIEIGKKRLNDERRMALELGSRILSKAKEVRDSLIQRTRAARGE